VIKKESRWLDLKGLELTTKDSLELPKTLSWTYKRKITKTKGVQNETRKI